MDAPSRRIAEIGVSAGGFSRWIVQFHKPAELHLIDSWQFVSQFPAQWYGGAARSIFNREF
jgi:hypothetical protein